MRISTYTGRQVDLQNLQCEDVDIRDIAHALSLQCRYNGQCRRFYSVAEHSVAVAARCPRGLRLYGLLHDAAEAYCGDIARPIKEAFPPIAAWECEIQHRIQSALGHGWHNGEENESLPPAVRTADDRMLATEAPQLGIRLDRSFEPYRWHHVCCFAPEQAERRFLEAFELLTRADGLADAEELLVLRAISGQDTGRLEELPAPASAEQAFLEEAATAAPPPNGQPVAGSGQGEVEQRDPQEATAPEQRQTDESLDEEA